MGKQVQGEIIKRKYIYSFPVLFITICGISVLFNSRNVKCDAGVSEILEGGDEEREVASKGACDADSPKRTLDLILPHLLNIYGSKATSKDFEIYAPNATFEDPLMSAYGIQEIKSAFYSLPKVFSESRIVDYSVREDVISPTKQEILIDNKQHYKILGRDINMVSLIKLEVEDGRIIRHEDWWDKKPILNRDNVDIPLVGRVLEATRRGSMLVTHTMMRFVAV